MAMKTAGRITIVTTIKRFRRYSRSSFWKMARLRRAEPHLPFLRLLVDQLEINLLERMARFDKRQEVASAGEQALA